MYGVRVFEFAESHARVRARLGAMPNDARWRYIADATELDNLIGRMRDNGLGYWVRELPRNPDTATIEDHLYERLWSGVVELGRLLPPRWSAARRWLRWGAELLLAERMLIAEQAGLGSSRPGPLRGAPPARRGDDLAGNPYRHYLDTPLPFIAWLGDFAQHAPRQVGHEGYIVSRLTKTVGEHYRQVQAACERSPQEGDALDIGWQWRLRGALAEELRGLIGGYPFHAGLVLIYGLLELLQYERCRALLIGRSRNWEPAELHTGVPA